VRRQRRRAGSELGEDQAALLDGAEEPLVRARVDDVDAGAEDGDGDAAGIEGGGVRGGVDAARQAGDHRDAGGDQLRGEVAGGVERVGRGAARADDGDRGQARQGEVAAEEERRRRVGDLAQQRRVVAVVERHRARAQRLDLAANVVVP